MTDAKRRKRAVSFIIKGRTERKKFLSAALFSEPAWDMLLKLYAVAIDRQAVSIQVLAGSASVQPSTAVRWIAALEKENLVRRQGADTVALSEKGWLAMESYFESMSSGEM